MAIMRVTCELAGELRFSMAVMRRTALLEQRADRIVALAVAPDVSSQSHPCAACSPLEDCRSPHRQTETGPLTGPGFLSGVAVSATLSKIMRRQCRPRTTSSRHRPRGVA